MDELTKVPFCKGSLFGRCVLFLRQQGFERPVIICIYLYALRMALRALAACQQTQITMQASFIDIPRRRLLRRMFVVVSGSGDMWSVLDFYGTLAKVHRLSNILC